MRRYSPPYYSPPRRGYSNRARSPPRRGYGRRKEPIHGSLLVRNIPLDCRPDELRVPFERFGLVRDVYLPKDYYTGEPRGFAFVQFVDSYDALDAQYHMNGQIFAGREISVVVASESRKRPEEMRKRTRTREPSGYGSRRSSRHGHGRSRSQSLSCSPSPRHRSRHRSRSYSPAPSRRNNHISPKQKNTVGSESPLELPSRQRHRSYSPSENNGEKHARNGLVLRSPSVSRSRSRD